MNDQVRRAGERVTQINEWVKDLRAMRSFKWYVDRRGALLCGGIAYTALFSLFAALAIGFTVFSVTLGNRPELQDAVFEQIDTWLPGLIGEEGAIQPDQLILDSALTWTNAVFVAVLLFSAIGFMRAIRVSVRSMFDQPVVGVSPVLSKVWELAGFALLGVMFLASAATSILSQTISRQVTAWFGDSVLLARALSVGTLAVGVLLDALLVYLIVRVVARVRPRHGRDFLIGCLAAGLVAGVLRWAGTSIVTSSATDNPILGSFAALVTVLVLVNFVARVLLLVCAWVYDPPRLDEIDHAEQEIAARRDAAEVDRIVRRGQGSGKPWSPVVRGVRRGSYGIGASLGVSVRTRG